MADGYLRSKIADYHRPTSWGGELIFGKHIAPTEVAPPVSARVATVSPARMRMNTVQPPARNEHPAVLKTN